MKISILTDNQTWSNQFGCEHGLSIAITTNSFLLLIDTGQSDLFLRNAQTLNIALAQTDAVICTHWHYDHTGGLATLLEQHPELKVWMHKDAFCTRYSHSSATTKSNGVPHRVQKMHQKQLLHTIDKTTQILPQVWLISLPQAAPANSRLCIRDHNQALAPDPFPDELFVLIHTLQGAVLVTGCAHYPLPDVLTHIEQQMGITRYRCIVGGLHLAGAHETTISAQIAQCKKFSIHQWALNHCTCQNALLLWKEEFGQLATRAQAGREIVLDEWN